MKQPGQQIWELSRSMRMVLLRSFITWGFQVLSSELAPSPAKITLAQS